MHKFEDQPTGEQFEPAAFSESFRSEFETLLRWRRDVRAFRRDPVDPDLIRHLLALGQTAPSVGNSQPWRFVLVETAEKRNAIRSNFQSSNAEALGEYAGERAHHYASLKLAGLDDAPVHLAVYCDTGTGSGHGLGRRTMPEMLHYSVVTAIHTVWLAARAHGVGVGWVSILDPVQVNSVLDVPDEWDLIAYLCIGYPPAPADRPELERRGWQGPDPDAIEVLYR